MKPWQKGFDWEKSSRVQSNGYYMYNCHFSSRWRSSQLHVLYLACSISSVLQEHWANAGYLQQVPDSFSHFNDHNSKYTWTISHFMITLQLFTEGSLPGTLVFMVATYVSTVNQKVILFSRRSSDCNMCMCNLLINVDVFIRRTVHLPKFKSLKSFFNQFA